MIQVKNLSYQYPDATKNTIQNITFSVASGEIFGFLGPSGAGKSTTQKIVNGILKNFTGQVKVLNQNLQRINSTFYEEIGVAFEFPNLYPKLTALENLRFFASLYKKPTANPIHLLSLVCLGDDGNTRVENFSKGMKMRLNFIRSLLNDPKLLFLDEPTSGLDPVNQRLIRDLILQQKSLGKTIFLTTHNMTVADELCDRVAFIIDGELKNVDSPRNLKLKYSQKQVAVEFRQNGNTDKRIFELKNIGKNSDFLRLLASDTVETIHTTEASLEDVFIRTTGRELK